MALSGVVGVVGDVAESVEFVEETAVDFAEGATIILCATGAQLDVSPSVIF